MSCIFVCLIAIFTFFMSLCMLLYGSLLMALCVLSAGCDRLHLLLQDPYERPGPAGTSGQPVAHRQQHHRLPPPPHPLGPLLSASPAGAASSPAPPAQPHQRAALAGPQVVQPKRRAHPSFYTFRHCPPFPSKLYTEPCTVLQSH